jgi:hypothetical protein
MWGNGVQDCHKIGGRKDNCKFFFSSSESCPECEISLPYGKRTTPFDLLGIDEEGHTFRVVVAYFCQRGLVEGTNLAIFSVFMIEPKL